MRNNIATTMTAVTNQNKTVSNVERVSQRVSLR